MSWYIKIDIKPVHSKLVKREKKDEKLLKINIKI